MGDHPYSFTPTYPIQEAIDLSLAVRSDPRNIVRHLKHACGIVGCVCEKHDDEPDLVVGQLMPTASGRTPDLIVKAVETSDLTELCNIIEMEGRACQVVGGEDPAQMSGILLQALQALITMLLSKWLGG